MFTTNSTGYPGWKHIAEGADGKKDFSEVIALAKKCEAPQEIETGSIVGGFAHAQVFALADKVVDAIKSGAIRKFVVMAGCDGRMKSRSYYEEFAKALPKDTVILTSGCAETEGDLRTQRHQRSAHLLQYFMVRAKGRYRTAGTPVARRKEYPYRSYFARLRI